MFDTVYRFRSTFEKLKLRGDSSVKTVRELYTVSALVVKMFDELSQWSLELISRSKSRNQDARQTIIERIS